METEIKENSGVHAHVVFEHASRTIRMNSGDAIKRAGLTSMQFSILDVLYCLGNLTVSAIKAKTLASSGNLTLVLKNMERDGLINRIACPEDKRSYRFSITSKGRAVFESVLPAHRQELEALYGIFSQEEREVLINLLKRFKEVAQVRKGEGK